MRRTYSLFLAAALLFFAALPVAGQKFQPKTIQFKGAPEYSDQELLAAAGLEEGMALSTGEINEHARQLMRAGVFSALSFKLIGGDLVFTLVPARLYPIRLENLPLTPGNELDAALHSRFPLYHGKVPASGGLTEDVRQALETMLAAQGVKATVAAATYADLKLHKVTTVTFSITAPPVRVGAIHLEGISDALEADAQLAAGHVAGTPFDTDNSARDLERAIGSFYGDEGYAAAKVHAFRSGVPVATAEAIDIPFSVTVEEGRRYKLGSVRLPPNALVTQAEIDKAFDSDSQSPAKGPILRTTSFMITSRYRSKGYLDCAVTPHPEFDEAFGAVNYTFEVIPGPVYHLAIVKFVNVSEPLRRRLARAWKMLPRAPFDESYVSGFVAKAEKDDPVLKRGLADMKVSFDILADPQTHGVNCVLRFSKA